MGNYKDNIEYFFSKIDNLNLKDLQYLEHYLIPELGLNNENLNEQPKELSKYFGSGLGMRIWQYPNQFSKYLLFLSDYAKKIHSYLEIGCRYGGTFILHYHYLKSVGSQINRAVSVDLIDASDMLSEYCDSGSIFQHLKMNSLSTDFIDYINSNFFDLIFIDGDHSYDGVKNDSENTEGLCNIKVFHDIINDACPGTVEYWNEIKSSKKNTYDFFEFNDQYDSVNGSYLGIGAAVRKDWITIK